MESLVETNVRMQICLINIDIDRQVNFQFFFMQIDVYKFIDFEPLNGHHYFCQLCCSVKNLPYFYKIEVGNIAWTEKINEREREKKLKMKEEGREDM